MSGPGGGSRGAPSRPLRVAVDGPSGAGKSTLARALARRLGLPYVDTGAMYRALAWKARRLGLREPAAIVPALGSTELRVDPDPEAFRVWVDGIDVTGDLREPDVGALASRLAAVPEVRAWMLPRQRDLAREGGVLEGRDIGTKVLPDADVKFFVTAAEATRVVRRRAQLGAGAAEAADDVRRRDRRDRRRTVAPLRPAPDAVRVDTTDQTVEESLETMLAAVGRRGRAR